MCSAHNLQCSVVLRWCGLKVEGTDLFCGSLVQILSLLRCALFWSVATEHYLLDNLQGMLLA